MTWFLQTSWFPALDLKRRYHQEPPQNSMPWTWRAPICWNKPIYVNKTDIHIYTHTHHSKKKNILHLLQLHVVSKVTRPEHDLLLRIPQMLLQEVSRLHRPLQQCLIPQNSSYASVGREHQTWGQQGEKWHLGWLGETPSTLSHQPFFSFPL